jgi:hypothetical protein
MSHQVITWNYGAPDDKKRGGFGIVEIYRHYNLAIKTISNPLDTTQWKEVCCILTTVCFDETATV